MEYFFQEKRRCLLKGVERELRMQDFGRGEGGGSAGETEATDFCGAQGGGGQCDSGHGEASAFSGGAGISIGERPGQTFFDRAQWTEDSAVLADRGAGVWRGGYYFDSLSVSG